MQFTVISYLIACPLCFLAGLVDSIGGGGGLISLPAMMLAGLPVHMAIGTNKIQSLFNTGMSSARMIRNRCIVWPLVPFPLFGALAGSVIGANLSLLVDDAVFSKIMIAALPIIAIFVFNGKVFTREDGHIPKFNLRTVLGASLAAFLISIYDGFYGPGAGTFLIIAYTALAHFDVRFANGHAKITNLAMSVSSMIVYLQNGQCVLGLGIATGCCAMLGSYIGSGLLLKNGSRIVRPIVLLVIMLLLIKIIFRL